jgi:hypothetical protein
VANRDWSSAGKLYSMYSYPVLVSCNFIVDSTNSNGLGIRNLKGPTVKNVFMQTTATPAKGNPNPFPGTMIVQLADNYNSLISLLSATAIASIDDGSNISIDSGTLDPGQSYVISVLGDATIDEWIAAGLPRGITPAVGVPFIATSTGTGPGTSTSRVGFPTNIGNISDWYVLGDPDLTLSAANVNSPDFKSQIILTSEGFQNPSDGTTFGISFLLSNSGVTVGGQ